MTAAPLRADTNTMSYPRRMLILTAPAIILTACGGARHVTAKKQETMFTTEQIRTAHAKVKSGADFPAYIREIKQLGVTAYITYVADGRTEYHGGHGFTTASAAAYAPLDIAAQHNREAFAAALKAHQQGKTGFAGFVADCARWGVEKWMVRMDEMTCTYYDGQGNTVLTEAIPQ